MMCDQCRSLKMIDIAPALFACEKCGHQQPDAEWAKELYDQAQADFNEAIEERRNSGGDPGIDEEVASFRQVLTFAKARYLAAIGEEPEGGEG